MDTTARVQRWRQRRRDEGKEALSIWLSHDTKLRLEDLAATWRTTPSDIIEQALSQFHPGTPLRLGNDTETLPLREAIEAVLADVLPPQIQAALQAWQPVTGTNGNVTKTQGIETAPETLVAMSYAEPEAGHDVITEPEPIHTGGNQPRARGEIRDAVLDVLAHRQPATPAEIATALGDGSKAGIKRVWQALQRLCKSGKVRQDGRQYMLAAQ